MSSSEDTADVLWGRCVASLEKSVESDEMDMWIRPLQPERTAAGLRLYAANVFAMETVRDRYLPRIREALPPCPIELTVGTRPRPADAPVDADAGADLLTESSAAVTKRAPKPTKISEPGYLPFMWGEASRAIPSSLVRCALFTVNTYGPEAERPSRQRTRISSQRNLTVYVTGEETNIFDRDVLMQLLQYQRRFKVGERFSFSARQVLQDMGLPTGGVYTKKLLASIKRLRSTALELHEQDTRGTGGGKFGEFNLINEFFRDESAGAGSQNWVISFNQTVADMMGRNSLTLLIWAQSQRLSSSLAKGLHGYYASHNPPYAVSVSFLREMTGSNIRDLHKFRRSLKDALEELTREGFLESWRHIRDGDLIAVVRAKLRLEATGPE